jgi:hypothetical protein
VRGSFLLFEFSKGDNLDENVRTKMIANDYGFLAFELTQEKKTKHPKCSFLRVSFVSF